MILWVGGLRLLLIGAILAYLWEVSQRIKPVSLSETPKSLPLMRLSWVAGPDVPILFHSGNESRVLAKGEEIQITGVVGMGRDRGNTIQVSDPYISAYHTRLAPAQKGWYLTDLASKNGTWRNNDPIREPVLIRMGDSVRIGETTFVFKG